MAKQLEEINIKSTEKKQKINRSNTEMKTNSTEKRIHKLKGERAPKLEELSLQKMKTLKQQKINITKNNTEKNRNHVNSWIKKQLKELNIKKLKKNTQ